MKRLLIILFLSFACIHAAYAQYNTNQNKVWAFGTRAGLDFTSGAPVSVNTDIHTSEGSASVCDKDGNLLFYTEGSKVWNRTHSVMPAGDSICPYVTSSSSQSTVIVPVMNYIAGSEPTQYYVFSIQGMEYLVGGDTTALNVYYSLVDMTLAGGMGDVVPGASGIFLRSRVCEKIIAVPGANCDVWVLLHAIEEPVFYAYNISACGLNTSPVVSLAGDMDGFYSYGFGVMKSSPDNRKVAVFNPSAATNLSGYPLDYPRLGTELLDFDPATGILSNCVRVSSGRIDGYGEFSPDNSKLYVVYRNDTNFGVVQYDITDTAAITASEYRVAESSLFCDMRLGPDDKIYFRSGSYSDHLACIASPNSAGAACTYQAHAITLLPGCWVGMGITNIYQAPVSTPTDTATSYSDTLVCFEGIDSITLTAPFPGCHHWADGGGKPWCKIGADGKYTVTSVTGCIAYKHTFNVATASVPCATAITAGVAAHNISIYPNPATNEFYVRTDGLLAPGSKALLYDVTGRLVSSYPLTSHRTTISLSGIPAGVYTVRILLHDTAIIKRLTITK